MRFNTEFKPPKDTNKLRSDRFDSPLKENLSCKEINTDKVAIELDEEIERVDNWN